LLQNSRWCRKMACAKGCAFAEAGRGINSAA
jgi:hypothetical protein